MPRQFSSQSFFHFLFKHSPLPIRVSMSWPSPWLSLGSVTCGNFEMGHSKSNSSKLRTISATGLAGCLQIRFRSMSVIHLSCSFFDRCWYRWANTKRFGSLLRLVIKSTRYWGLTTTKSLISELWFSAVTSFPGGRSLEKKTDNDIILNSRWLAPCYRPIHGRSLGVTPLFGERLICTAEQGMVFRESSLKQSTISLFGFFTGCVFGPEAIKKLWRLQVCIYGTKDFFQKSLVSWYYWVWKVCIQKETSQGHTIKSLVLNREAKLATIVLNRVRF